MNKETYNMLMKALNEKKKELIKESDKEFLEFIEEGGKIFLEFIKNVESWDYELSFLVDHYITNQGFRAKNDLRAIDKLIEDVLKFARAQNI